LLQAMLARRINASGSSSWPTCRANEGNGGDYQKQADGSTQPTLTGAAAMWSTPHASDPQMDRRSDESVMRWANRAQAGCELSIQVRLWQTPAADSFRSRGGDRKDEMGLDQQARRWPSPRSEDAESCCNHPQATDSLTGAVRQWATPNARDYKGSPTELTREDGKTRLDQLDRQAENWETFSRPVPATDAGPVSSPNTPTLRRRLNPAFACWLMGLPWWWTRAEPISFAAQETASWHSALRRRLRQFFEE
jgi:hypothetical protein